MARVIPRSDPRVREEDLKREIEPELELLAKWMDSVFKIPGLGIRFGLDSLIGLIPGLGDTATSVVSLYILNAASRYGASRATIARMAANIAIEYVIGSIPLVGDLFDVYWKSNKRNVELLRRHALATPEEQRRAQQGDRWFVIFLMGALVALLVGTIAIGWLILAAIGRLLFNV